MTTSKLKKNKHQNSYQKQNTFHSDLKENKIIVYKN